MSDLTHFDLLPLSIDQQTAAVSAKSSSRTLAAELTALNTLHHQLQTMENPHQIPPPIPSTKRTAQITKLREQGNEAYKSQSFGDAIRLYTQGFEVAASRPPWEPAQVVREEVAGLLANRAQAHMALGEYAEGLVDAKASVEAKRQGNGKAWWRAGRCLIEMGRWEEGRVWLREGLEVEGEDGDLGGLLGEVEGLLAKKRAA